MWLAAVPLALCAAIAAHAVAVRLAPGANRPASFLAVGTVVGLAALVWVGARYGLSLQLAGFALSYAFACELYLFLFSSALTSISMNLLVRLLHQPMTDAEIAQAYDSRRMVERRIERLTATGLAARGLEGRLHTTDAGKRFLGLFRMLSGFFRNLPVRSPAE